MESAPEIRLPVKRIFLIRHGESLSQTGEADKEDLNPALSRRGRAQAQRLRPLMKGIVFDLILLSTMQRAIQTYELSGARGKQVRYDSRLIEGDWGIPNYYKSLEGLSSTLKPIAEADRQEAYLVPFETRVSSLLEEIVSLPDRTILLFGHFGIFSRLLAYFLGIASDERIGLSPMENTAISILAIQDDGKRILEAWNERAHVMPPFGNKR